MKKYRKLYFFVVALSLVTIAALLLTYYFIINPKNEKETFSGGEKTITLQIIYADKQFTYENLDGSGVSTVFDLLKKYDEELDLGMKYSEDELGIFLTELKNTPQNEKNGDYYTYTINDEYALAIFQQTIADRDIIKFRLSNDTYEENANGEWVLTKSILVKISGVDNRFIFIIGMIGVLVVLAILYIVCVEYEKRKKVRDRKEKELTEANLATTADNLMITEDSVAEREENNERRNND